MNFIMAMLRPLAYLSLPIIAFRYMSSRSQLARYYIRLSLYISAIAFCSAWGVFISIPMTIVGRRFDINYVVSRSFYAIAGRLLGIKFVIEGAEYLNTRPAVLVGNHQSMLDILYLGAIFPRRASIMAKKELQWMPFLGQYMSLSGAVFVDRSNNKNAVQSLAEAGSTMKSRNTSLWLFPEGTRHSGRKAELLPFKKGAFHLAVQAGVPIVPVVCENYWRLYRKGSLESGTLKIKVLPPIETKSLSTADVNELALRTRDTMLESLIQISGVDAAPLPDNLPSSIPQQPPIGVTELKKEGVEEVKVEAPVTRRNISRDSGAETEEDEGMVLVGHPA